MGNNKFANALKNESQKTYTTNGSLAYKTTGNDLVDLFATIGAMRNRPEEDVIKKFDNAFKSDKLLATKCLFYARDITGGLGERKVFRLILNHLAKIAPDVVRKNMDNIPYYGRYDDLYSLIKTPVENDMWRYINRTLYSDLNNMKRNKSVTLLAKWLKSTNASSNATRVLGRYTAGKLGMSEKNYRKMLSQLRAYIDVVERKMSSNNWDKINYSAVPSNAMNIYRNAFISHDKKGFTKYLDLVSCGEAKINAGTLYPYNIVEKYMDMGMGKVLKKDDVLEAQWNNLPNYVDSDSNVLVVVDISGSMWGRPLATSVGLGIYFAQRNHGDFKNTMITFSEVPEVIDISGDNTLAEAVTNTMKSRWGFTTDLEATFRLILKMAIKNNVPLEDMPKSIVVVTDMQFNGAVRNNSSIYESVREEFANNGYELPNVVFWNVNSPKDTFQINEDNNGIQMVSGQSVAVFKTVMNCIGKTPLEAVMYTLNNERYERVVV